VPVGLCGGKQSAARLTVRAAAISGRRSVRRPNGLYGGTTLCGHGALGEHGALDEHSAPDEHGARDWAIHRQVPAHPVNA
jgi:hypothetical protein